MLQQRQGNSNRNIPNRNNYSKNDKIGVFGKLGIGKIGQGRRLRTSKTDSPFGTGKSLVNKLLRAKLRRGKMQLKNLSEKNIGQIDDLISERLKKHTSSNTAYLTRKEARNIKIKAWKMYKNTPGFSKEDFKDLKRVVKAIRAGGDRAKQASHILRISGVSSDNTGVSSNITKSDFKLSNLQNITTSPVSSFNTDQSKNEDLASSDRDRSLSKDIEEGKDSKKDADDVDNEVKDLPI